VPEHLLTLRAEAAEATVRTLESHLATVQQRLRDAEEESRRLSEALVADASTRRREGGEQSGRTGVLERELQRARQREQAEHRARVDAEDRAVAIERDDRAEIEQLASRLSASERYVRALAAELAEVEARVLEAERAAATRRAAADDERTELERRLAAIERTAIEVGRGLESERAERERAERLLAGMRRGQRRVEALVRDLGTIVSRLRAHTAPLPPVPPARAAGEASRLHAALAPSTASAPASPGVLAPAGRAPEPISAVTTQAQRDRSAELATALASAVERLRAGAQESAGVTASPVAPPVAAPPNAQLEADAPQGEQAVTARPTHKHSYSLIGRVRMSRKQRRERR
jgi:hypothetical protein